MAKKKTTPLQENAQVKELLSILEENHVDAADLRGLIGYIGAMERQLETAVGELAAMRQELSGMREEQNHPARTALRGAALTLEGAVNDAREKLEAVKNSVIEGCKNAVAAFKEKGIGALNNLAGFFKIGDGLQSLRDSLDGGVQAAEKSIAKIEAVSAEYHEAGQHVKNMGRTLSGKDPVQEAKPSGKLAKLLESPFKTELSCLTGARKSVGAAIGKLERLEQSAERPSVLENIRAFQEKAARTKQDAPETGRPKHKEVSL